MIKPIEPIKPKEYVSLQFKVKKFVPKTFFNLLIFILFGIFFFFLILSYPQTTSFGKFCLFLIPLLETLFIGACFETETKYKKVKKNIAELEKENIIYESELKSYKEQKIQYEQKILQQKEAEEKYRKEEVQRKQEQLRIKAQQQRIAEITARKIATEKAIEFERLKKIEEEKYETVFVVSTSINTAGKHQAYFKRNDNTYISVTSTSALTANSNLKQLKENTTKWTWISAAEFEGIRQREEQQRLNVARLQEQINEQRRQQEFLIFCDNNSEYCVNLRNAIQLDKSEPFAVYPSIQKISRDFQVWDELGNGVNILSTPEQLSQYIFSYGKMHRAKLYQAFETCIDINNYLPNGEQINIIDYGCGQGLGTVALIDFLHTKTNFNCTFGKITLIEPSVVALKRASLHVHTSLEVLGRTPIITFQQIFPLTKTINEITEIDLVTTEHAIKFHIFSNILDIPDYDYQSLCRKITATQKGKNYFVCVSPNFWSGNTRLNNFASHFVQHHQAIIISERDSDIGKWKRYEKVFKADFPNNTRGDYHLNLRTPATNILDDLPF